MYGRAVDRGPIWGAIKMAMIDFVRRAMTPGGISAVISLCLATVAIGLAIGTASHAHTDREHCTNDAAAVLLEQVASTAWAVTALCVVLPTVWYTTLLIRPPSGSSGWKLRVFANVFIWAALVILPILGGTILAKSELASRSCDVGDHVALASALASFLVLFPVCCVLFARVSLNNLRELVERTGSSEMTKSMYVCIIDPPF